MEKAGKDVGEEAQLLWGEIEGESKREMSVIDFFSILEAHRVPQNGTNCFESHPEHSVPLTMPIMMRQRRLLCSGRNKDVESRFSKNKSVRLHDFVRFVAP